MTSEGLAVSIAVQMGAVDDRMTSVVPLATFRGLPGNKAHTGMMMMVVQLAMEWHPLFPMEFFERFAGLLVALPTSALGNFFNVWPSAHNSHSLALGSQLSQSGPRLTTLTVWPSAHNFHSLAPGSQLSQSGPRLTTLTVWPSTHNSHSLAFSSPLPSSFYYSEIPTPILQMITTFPDYSSILLAEPLFQELSIPVYTIH
uniref:Predicted protein n=1 Tax=Physcomitrium patens TaxID=3218 RepID=A9U5S0_PHYPA